MGRTSQGSIGLGPDMDTNCKLAKIIWRPLVSGQGDVTVGIWITAVGDLPTHFMVSMALREVQYEWEGLSTQLHGVLSVHKNSSFPIVLMTLAGMGVPLFFRV